MAELDRLIPAGVLKDPQLQAKTATAVSELLRPIPDAILRFGYARGAATRLGIPVEMLARRMGGGRQEPAPSPPQPASAPSIVEGGTPKLVRSEEEKVLQELFQQEDPARIPPLESLPPPEVFFDTECRNIYEAFCALYAEAGSPQGLSG